MTKNYVAAIAYFPFNEGLCYLDVLFFAEEPTKETVLLNFAQKYLVDCDGDTEEEKLEEMGYNTMEGFMEHLFGNPTDFELSILPVPED